MFKEDDYAPKMLTNILTLIFSCLEIENRLVERMFRRLSIQVSLRNANSILAKHKKETFHVF